MEDQKPGLVRKQNVAKLRGFDPKVNVFKTHVKLWRRGEETNVTQAFLERFYLNKIPVMIPTTGETDCRVLNFNF